MSELYNKERLHLKKKKKTYFPAGLWLSWALTGRRPAAEVAPAGTLSTPLGKLHCGAHRATIPGNGAAGHAIGAFSCLSA